MAHGTKLTQGIASLPDYIEAKFQKYAAHPAYSALGQTMSFADIDEKSRALAAWLQKNSSLEEGDRIAIQLPNLLQNPIAVYGALRAGLVVVNTNPLYTSAEMQHQFADSGAKALIILADFLPKFEAIKQQTQITEVIATGAAEMLSETGVPTSDHYISFSKALGDGAKYELRARTSVSKDATCMLQYTGGTTGLSKGAALSHENILSNSLQTLERLGESFVEAKEVVVCPLPLYHIYAFTVCMMTFFAKGSHTVLIPNPRDMDAFVKAMQPYKMTTFCGLNTLFIGLSQHPAFKRLDFSAFKLTLSGGTALTQAAVDMWQQATGCSITEGYGLSETAPVLTFNQPGKEHLGTVGQPLVETDIAILDDSDQPVSDGQTGQIAARGPQVMQGYWQRADETAKVMTQDGFFKTGDIGVRMPDGCIKIVDRLKDLIIVSGFNVYPNEVEDVLSRHPDVLEAAVVGAADERTGEKVCAYITVRKEVARQELIEHCRKSLTPYKVPKQIRVVDELPKSPVGKILRRKLRQ